MDEVNTTVVANESLASASASVRWRPKQLVFRPYAAPVVNSEARTRNLGVSVKRPVSDFNLSKYVIFNSLII